MSNLLLKVASATKDAIVVIDGDSRILLWNEGAEVVFGYPKEACLGQSLTMMMPVRYRQRHMDALERIKKAQEMVFTGKTVELYGIHRDGREIPLEATLANWQEDGQHYFSAIIRDISERIALEERNERVYQSQIAIGNLLQIALQPLELPELLQESLKTILSIPWLSLESRGAIFLLDEAGENLRLTAQHNLPEMIAKNCELVPLGHCLCGHVAVSREVTFISRAEARHRLPEGVQEHGRYSIPILFSDRLLGVMMAYVPPDHRGVAEEEKFLITIANTLAGVIERKEGERRLRAAKEAAELASRYKSEFLATISHEVRTPLNGIMGMAALLMEKHLSSKKLFYVEMIRKSGENLLNIINDVLDLSKIEAGHLRLETQPFSPREMRNELRDLFGELATKKGLHLRTRIASDVPQLVEGDVHRIRQILVNLLSNAIKFTEKGEITLRILAAEDPVDKLLSHLEFQVEDTGIGIAADVAERLFQPFTQGDASTTRKYGGSGLGLAICRRLAERMDGQVTLSSQEGGGSIFFFRVPLRKAGLNRGGGGPEMEERLERVVFSPGVKVLVAEDNIVNQKLFQIILKGLGVTVTTVENGHEALRCLRDGRFQLVLMDCHMPEMDGLSACAAFRQYEQENKLPRTPLVAVTANAMAGERERCLAAGMDDFLTKPIAKGEIQSLLLRYVDSARYTVKN
ncbi:MAG: response regulator [Magnetococcales bacterium]|nr:response regulator [Magnetococcales bacterium]MBF0115126.1 response regulator [Magnetococcales bacterium]